MAGSGVSPPVIVLLPRPDEQAIGYWGQASSLVYCTRVYESVPDLKECVTPLRNWKRYGPLELFYSCILAEFREGTLSWDEVLPEVGTKKEEALKLDVYVWPMVMAERHGRGKLLLRRAFV
jgi:hypothetical protein